MFLRHSESPVETLQRYKCLYAYRDRGMVMGKDMEHAHGPRPIHRQKYRKIPTHR